MKDLQTFIKAVPTGTIKVSEVSKISDKDMIIARNEVPIADKALLTLEEAAKYFNIGMPKIRELTSDDHCPYVLWNGSKRLIKRKPFEEYLYKQYSI